MNNWIIIGFYNDNYCDKATRLMQSVRRYNLPIDLVKIDYVHKSISNKGTVESNNTKPNFILTMMDKYPHIKNFVYLDCDMVVNNFPDFSEYGVKLNGVNNYLCNWNTDSTDKIANMGAVQIYSNNDQTKEVLRKWHYYSKMYPNVVDDQMLSYIHNNIEKIPSMNNLPVEFCYYNIPHQDKKGITERQSVFKHPDTISDNTKRKYEIREWELLKANNLRIKLGNTILFI